MRINFKNMKKLFLSVLTLSALLVSCSSDDDNTNIPEPDGGGQEENTPDETPDETTGQAIFLLNEVEYLNNSVEIFNAGDAAGDLSTYFLCLGPGTYRQIGTLETEGNLQLGAGEFLSISYNMPNAEGGLGLYVNDSGFGDASNIADFVQWGAGGSPRENVAVEAGIWTADEFVSVMGNENNSIVFDGEGNGAENWTETTTVTIGSENVVTMPEIESVVINEVQFGSLDQVEIYNNGNVEFNLDDYWLCLGPVSYTHLTLPTTPYV